MTEAQDLSHFVRHPADGVAAMDLVVNGVYCGACIVTIEKGLSRQAGVRGARVNLANRRVTVEWNEGALEPPIILERLEALGYPAFPFTAEAADSVELTEEKRLLRSLGVAAFGAMNVMLLSVSLWAGAENDPATRDLFHWLSALVALPCAAYAGMPFYESAARSARAGALNMDAPISLGVILGLAMSMLQTVTHRARLLFRSRPDAADVPARRAPARPAHAPAHARLRHQPLGHARRPGDEARRRRRGARDADRRHPPRRPGGCPPGERIAVDGAIEDGRSEVDQSLVTGETAPIAVAPGAQVYAGTLNLTGALSIRVQAAGAGTFLDEVDGLLASAVEQRSSYVRLADRAARLYVPVVHVTALATFLGWLALGAGWQPALIVGDHGADHHLPLCARAGHPRGAGGRRRSAVPPWADAPFGRGAGTSVQVDCVVFDKTGTLTQPRPALANTADIATEDLALAGRLALASRHPLARAIAEAAGAREPLAAEEFPGEGVSAPRRRRARPARLRRLVRGRGRGRRRSRRAGPTHR